MLRTALNEHPGITCHGEIFHVVNHAHSLEQNGVVEHLRKFNLAPHDGFIMHGLVPMEGQPYIQIYKDLWVALQVFHVPVISLRRRDLIRRCASAKIANKHNHWRRDSAADAATQDTCTLTVGELLRDCNHAADSFDEADVMFPEALVVFYEDLVSNWSYELARIQDFLGVVSQPLVPTTRKQDTRGIRQIITNYDDLRSRVRTPVPRWQELFLQAESSTGSTEVPTKS